MPDFLYQKIFIRSISQTGSHKREHLVAIEKTKLLTVESFPIDIHILEKRISEICKERTHCKKSIRQPIIFHFRVIRPQQPDNNPLHPMYGWKITKIASILYIQFVE